MIAPRHISPRCFHTCFFFFFFWHHFYPARICFFFSPLPRLSFWEGGGGGGSSLARPAASPLHENELVDGVGSGSRPLRWPTGELVSQCSSPHGLPCPSTPNLMITNAHLANHSLTYTAVQFLCPPSACKKRPKKKPNYNKKKSPECRNVPAVFVCLLDKRSRLIGGNGFILLVCFPPFPPLFFCPCPLSGPGCWFTCQAPPAPRALPLPHPHPTE